MPPGAGKPYLSVVLPAHRDASVLPASIGAIVGFVDSAGVHAEIVVVDDASPDRTAAVARDALRGGRGRVVLHAERRGPGAAVRTGVLAAVGRWVLIADAGLPVPLEDYDRLAAVCRERDVDGAIGVRSRRPGGRFRNAVDRGVGAFVRAATGLGYRDPRCPLRLLDRQRGLPLVEQIGTARIAWDVELLFLCARLGLAVAEVPVGARETPPSGFARPLDPAGVPLDVLRVRWRFRRGGYRGAQRPGSGPVSGPGPTQ